MGFIRNFIALYKDIKRNGEMASKYLQMTPEELSALNDEELREAIDSVLVYYIDKDDIERLNEVQLTVVTVVNLDMEVNNGGLCQFFVNSSADFAPYVSESLRLIGAEKIKKLFDQFVEESGIDLADLSSFKIEDASEFEEQNNRYPFDAFDEAYYEEEDLEVRLLEYVRKNNKQIFENIRYK